MRARLLIVAFVVGVSLTAAGSAWGYSVTPMCTTDQGGTQPCQDGWYGGAVTVTWYVDPTPNHVDGCGLSPYPTDAVATTSCGADWSDDSITRSYIVHVETSSPTAYGTPTRGPDQNGWYNHPVAVAFHGSSFSGIAGCSSDTYAGRASANATIFGSCTDNAGKTAGASVSIHYDATPPAVDVNADRGDRSVGLHWSSGGDVAPLSSVEVVRRPGLHGKKSSVLYRGESGTFRDDRVRNGVRYRYTLIARDQAGNVTVRKLTVIPGPHLVSPAQGQVVSGPPLLRWTPVHGADYYNLQLYRAGKVLSVWPAHARFQLSASWKFAGRDHHLRPGRYYWYVWPGFGSPAAAHYGARIGGGSFVVRAPG